MEKLQRSQATRRTHLVLGRAGHARPRLERHQLRHEVVAEAAALLAPARSVRRQLAQRGLRAARAEQALRTKPVEAEALHHTMPLYQPRRFMLLGRRKRVCSAHHLLQIHRQ